MNKEPLTMPIDQDDNLFEGSRDTPGYKAMERKPMDMFLARKARESDMPEE